MTSNISITVESSAAVIYKPNYIDLWLEIRGLEKIQYNDYGEEDHSHISGWAMSRGRSSIRCRTDWGKSYSSGHKSLLSLGPLASHGTQLSCKHIQNLAELDLTAGSMTRWSSVPCEEQPLTCPRVLCFFKYPLAVANCGCSKPINIGSCCGPLMKVSYREREWLTDWLSDLPGAWKRKHAGACGLDRRKCKSNCM